MFWDVIEDMARVGGIVAPPKAPNPVANGYHAQAESPEWATASAEGEGQIGDDSYLLTEGISDEAVARCVNRLYANRFLHTDALGWLHYTGRHWTAKGAETAVNRAIVDTLAKRIKAALNDDPEKHEKLIKFCIPNKGRVQGALYLFQSLVPADIDQFDAEPDLLNCKNGVVDLRTGALSPHNPTQRFTHCTTIDYKPVADSTPFLDWLTSAVEGGADTVAWLRMAIGYSLTGHTREEILFYLYGPPRSGKGTLTEMLLALLGGTLAKEVNFGTFTAQRTGDSQNFDLAPLKPCRMVMASESNAYERFNEAKVKMLTGGNEVYCAFKHQTHFGYRPQYKIWLSSNQTINADPDDDAVWGRIRVIEFPHSHLGTEDKALKHEMKSVSVLEGALVWAVDGARQWYALGRAGLPELACSAKEKGEHRAELDNVQAWIEENCEQSPVFASNATLYQSYEDWCKYRGIEPKKQKGFSQALNRKGYTAKIAKMEGKMVRGFDGLRVL
jgi:putative DNA primase/helicase